MKVLILAALSISGAFSQVAAKPETPPPATPAAGTPAPTVAPGLNTSRIWRLLSKVQTMRQQLNDSPQGKEVAAADAELQAEQQKLSSLCTAAGFVLGYQSDAKAENAGDLICVPKPKESAPASGSPVDVKAKQ